MKNLLSILILYLSFSAYGQSLDTAVVRIEIDSLIQLNNGFLKERKLDEALLVLQQAEKKCLTAFGGQTALFASIINKIGIVYYYKGEYSTVESFWIRAKNIRKEALGEEHSDYASSVNNLALVYLYMGQYEKAEPLFLESKSNREKVLGKEHPDYSGSLNNLAGLYMAMGQYEKAEPLFLESRAIREKVLGKEHPQYAQILGNLANLYREMRQPEKAEPLYMEAKDIREKVLGKEHPDYARSLNHLAGLYMDSARPEKAEPFYLESKEIREKTLGRDHPDYAISLNNLAGLYKGIGQYSKAELFYLESKAIREKVFGLEHPDYASSLNNLAGLYWRMGQAEQAEPLFLALSTVNKSLIERALHHLTESELHSYLDMFSRYHNQILSFTQMVGRNEMISDCYDNCLFYKGFLLQSVGRIKQLAFSNKATTEKYTLLKSVRHQLSAQYTRPITARDSVLADQLEMQANDIEKELIRTVSGYGEAMQQVRWQEVQKALQPEEAAIEFVHYRFYDPNETDSTMYAALLLLPDGTPPKFISLFEEQSLASLVETRGERRVDYINNLYSFAERGMVAESEKDKTLYELIWKPLEQELADINTVYFSPTGLLHRINLNALAVDEESNLVDHYTLVEVNSTRQQVLPSTMTSTSNDAILFGGIAYELDSMAMMMVQTEWSNEDLASRGEIKFPMDEDSTRGGIWNDLQWTGREVESIEEVLYAAGYSTTLRKRYDASEESFRSMGLHGSSPQVIHIATHGYFFPDSDQHGLEEFEPVFKMSDHPMIRSGLILAGGNQAWQNKPTLQGMEDGILTAYEISQMNLSNTELVVLSACETGLGDIQGNEGVYGLQRAFKIAGAKYLIMSLWQVPDRQTMQFMTTFYRNWLEEKMTIPEAFRKTQLEMRDRFFDAYNWAGFVLVE